MGNVSPTISSAKEETYHVSGVLRGEGPGRNFVCQLTVRNGTVVKAGPALMSWVGWTLARVESCIATKQSLKLHSGPL